jgi:hypothetical protein
MLSNFKLLNNSQGLIAAIKSVSSNLFADSCWVNQELKCIQISCLHQNIPLSAWGTDKNESIAFAKAIMELVERLHLQSTPFNWISLDKGLQIQHDELINVSPILNKFCQTSSGMAAHFSKKLAVKAAIAELIERHVLSKVIIESKEPDLVKENNYIWHGPLDHYVCLSIYNVPSQGYLFASSANTNLAASINKSNQELSSMIEWSKNSANIQEIKDKFIKNRPSEIQAYYLSQAKIPSFLNKLANSPISYDISEDDILIAEIPLLPEFQRIKSLKIIRAFSNKMQPLQFGPLKNHMINPLAINVDAIKPQVDYNVVA